ncbi:MAG: 23S rRNA (pseudouridine(1915)-N(3))-methyltransferase RlmH [Candidatus Schekmanbacteria bacterium]|nr:23S rRNA (pseudouridine(1915)-N(3))-methyltransferase RlmH [Candidatus Schekmanbacteria bacterium]
MKIRFIWIDKTKAGPEKDIIDDYASRIKRFADVEVIEIKSSARQENPESAMEEEARDIEKHLLKDSFFIATTPSGKEISSHKFAELMKDVLKVQAKPVVIVVGGRYGIAPRLIKASNLKLSISQMTLNHYLVRIFLFEQVYRGFCIMDGLPYAK